MLTDDRDCPRAFYYPALDLEKGLKLHLTNTLAYSEILDHTVDEIRNRTPMIHQPDGDMRQWLWKAASVAHLLMEVLDMENLRRKVAPGQLGLAVVTPAGQGPLSHAPLQHQRGG